MSTQKKTIKVFMFLLPALVTLLGYTAFHDMLFKERPCLINCDSSFSDNEKLKKWLAFLESLRDNPFATNPARKSSAPTALDLAFLQDKFDATNQHGDYFGRYRQIINDLTNPTVVKEVNEERKLPVHIAQLSDPSTTSDTNTQTFVGDQPPSDTTADPTFLVGSAGTPRTRGPLYFDNSQPPVSGGGSESGGNENPNNGGTSGGGGNAGGGNNSGGGGAPSSGGNTGGNGNPISSVPAPKAVYLLLGLIAIVTTITIRFKFYQRTD